MSRLVLVLLALSTLAVLAISIHTWLMMNPVSTFLKEDIELRLIVDARGAALIVTTEELGQLQTPEDMDTPLNVFREDIEKRLAAGMNDHVGKPLNLSDVMEKLHSYLPKHT